MRTKANAVKENKLLGGIFFSTLHSPVLAGFSPYLIYHRKSNFYWLLEHLEPFIQGFLFGLIIKAGGLSAYSNTSWPISLLGLTTSSIIYYFKKKRMNPSHISGMVTRQMSIGPSSIQVLFSHNSQNQPNQYCVGLARFFLISSSPGQ